MSANCLIAYPNVGDRATLSGGSFAIPLTKLQTQIIKDPARTTDAVDGSFVIDGLFSESRPMLVFGLVRHNFTNEATYRIRLYSDEAMTVTEYDSGLLPVFDVIYTELTETWDSGNFWDLTISEEDRAGLTASIIHILPTTYTERAFKFEVFDSANEDGYLQAGRLFVGAGWIPVYNMEYGASLAFENRALVDESIGGTEYFDERENPRVARFSLPRISEDEAMGAGFELLRKQGVTKDVLYMWDSNDPLNVLRRSFLGRLRQLNPIEHDFFNNYVMQFEIKEKI